MRRFIVFDRNGEPLFDLDERIVSAVRTEKLKGEHKLDIETTQPLEEGMRILVRDGTLKWREWVVDEPDEHHTEEGMVGTYGCTWSMQYDLSTANGGELWPGMPNGVLSPISAGSALSMVLATQTMWEVGNVYVDPQNLNGTTLYDGQVWDYLGELQEVWGGEMEPRIVVDGNGVTHRYVDWHAHFGQTEATRRFDFGEDCTSIRRKVAPGPRYCWIEPRGGRDAQDADGVRYSARCGVEEEPQREEGDFIHYAGGKYVRDQVTEYLFRTKGVDGKWRYPTKVVCYDLDTEGDQEELLNKAFADVANWTRPKTTYEADVLQFAAAGLDPHGVQLGDEIQIVDRAFGDVPLRLQARVVEMTVNELDDTDVQLVIGEPNADLASSFKSLSKSIADADGRAREIQAGGTIAYVEGLLDEINKRIAADGGYTYMVNGQGTITYDKAVTDPLKGTEATQVVQMKGGSLRFANSHKENFQGIEDWNWQTVITSQGFLGLAATIAAITTGFIGSRGDTYINLDEHIAQIGQSSGPHLIVDANGVWVYNASTLLGFFGLESSNGIVRIGENGKMRSEIDWHSFRLIDLNGTSCFNVQDLRDTSGYATVEETWPIEDGSSAYKYILSATPTNTTYDVYVNSTRLTYGVNKYSTHFDILYNFGSSGTVRAVYTTTSNRATICTIGSRASGTTLGIGSAAIGTNVTASGGMSHAEGLETKALNHCSHAEGYQTEAANVFAHAEGSGSKANGEASHAGGRNSKADGRYSFAHGEYCEATGNYSIACGCQAKATSDSGSAAFGDGVTQSARGLACGGHNSTTDALFVVGSGTSSSNKKDAFYVKSSASYIPHGDLYVSGYVFDSSDRRLKKHVKYIDDDASEFIRKLRPALFEKDGSLQIGFYAQDVQNADEWGTSTVVETDMRSKELGFKPLTLNYQALIAPLVAYAQQLERRIDQQQQQIDALTRRLDALEGGA